MFNISEKAANEINRLLVEEGSSDFFLRIKVVPGGCSGFSYEMGFDDVIDESDQVQNIRQLLSHRCHLLSSVFSHHQ